MSLLSASTRATVPLTICASPRAKLIGGVDGQFPDIGHHSEREMAGLWMHPIKILDGFWLRFRDLDAANVNTWIIADECVQEAEGNRFFYRNGLGHTPVTIERSQLAPEEAPGVKVTYVFRNRADTPRRVEAEWRCRTELYPSWFALDAGARTDGRDEGFWDGARNVFKARDAENPEWTAAAECSEAPDEAETGDLFTPQGSGKGTCLSLIFRRTIPAGGEWMLCFRLTGSADGAEAAEENLRLLRNAGEAEARKRARMAEVLALSELRTGNPAWDEPWAWVKAHTEWLTVDAGKYGTGVAAGLPEYPWWFGCDSCYTVQGLLCVGRFELARQNLKLLADYSRRVNGNGRIVHEITPFGLCPNPGNTQETAHFVTAVWHYWQATGDFSLAEELLDLLRQSMEWLQSQDEDGDLLPGGYGIIEIQGLNAEMIDTAAYTCQAWECFAEILNRAGCAEEAARARELHRRTRAVLNTVMWDEEASLFCDACASPAFVRERVRQIQAWRRTPMSADQMAELERRIARREADGGEAGFLINYNWVIATPMESGQAEPEKARRALEAMCSEELIGPWGVRLSAADESTMTISTGCAAAAQARWDRPNTALDLLERMLSTFGKANPGMISEMSPDGGCAVQAWTAYALYVPVVRYFFGVQPYGEKDGLIFRPCMPDRWTQAGLHRVRLPGGYLDVDYRSAAEGETFMLRADHALRVLCRSAEGLRCGTEELLLRPGEPAEVLFTRVNPLQ